MAYTNKVLYKGYDMVEYKYRSHDRVYRMPWHVLKACLKREQSRIRRIIRGKGVSVIWTNSVHNLR